MSTEQVVVKNSRIRTRESQCPSCKLSGRHGVNISSVRKHGSVVSIKIQCINCKNEWYSEFKYFRKKDLAGRIIEPYNER